VTLQHCILGLVASAAAFGLSPAPAQAGSFSISPLRADLSASAQTGALTLRNQEAAPVVVQAQAMLWEQADGQEQLTPTRDILVNPAVFTLPANGSQLVRVALRRPADAQRELTYRLILTEVPQQASPDFTGLNVALRLSLPVFVAPSAAKAEPRLEWTAARTSDGTIAITARNAGNAHARVINFSVAPAAGSAAGIAQDVTAYVLPGQARTWALDKKHNATTSGTDWNQLRVKGTTEAGDFEVETRLGER
jgi:fimbrial chaperone protein